MGTLSVRVKVSNPSDGGKAFEQEMVVDTGAYMSILPRSVLEGLGIRPVTRRSFGLADGKTRIERDVGGATFAYGQYAGVSPVIFGEESDKALLGVLTIEALGLMVDPVKGELKPVEMFLLDVDLGT